jgi:hypothetical protein
MILNTPIRFVSSQNENVKIHSYQTAYNNWICYFHRQRFYKTYREVTLSKHFNVNFFSSSLKRFVKLSSGMSRFTSILPHREYNSTIFNQRKRQYYKTLSLRTVWAPIAWSVQQLVTSWTVRGLNPGRAEIFRTCEDSGAHPAFYIMDTGSFPGVKRPKRGLKHPSPSSAEVKERL